VIDPVRLPKPPTPPRPRLFGYFLGTAKERSARLEKCINHTPADEQKHSIRYISANGTLEMFLADNGSVCAQQFSVSADRTENQDINKYQSLH
jgi:hypothetical protein